MSGVFSGKATNGYQNHLKAVTNELVDNSRSMPPPPPLWIGLFIGKRKEGWRDKSIIRTWTRIAKRNHETFEKFNKVVDLVYCRIYHCLKNKKERKKKNRMLQSFVLFSPIFIIKERENALKGVLRRNARFHVKGNHSSLRRYVQI